MCARTAASAASGEASYWQVAMPLCPLSMALLNCWAAGEFMFIGMIFPPKPGEDRGGLQPSPVDAVRFHFLLGSNRSSEAATGQAIMTRRAPPYGSHHTFWASDR